MRETHSNFIDRIISLGAGNVSWPRHVKLRLAVDKLGSLRKDKISCMFPKRFYPNWIFQACPSVVPWGLVHTLLPYYVSYCGRQCRWSVLDQMLECKDVWRAHGVFDCTCMSLYAPVCPCIVLVCLSPCMEGGQELAPIVCSMDLFIF